MASLRSPHFSVSRYLSKAFSSSGFKGLGGILLPGLIDCESEIHPARLPRLLGKVPAAIVWRLAMCVRSGPSFPPAPLPRTVWHITQGWERNTCSPCLDTRSDGGGGVLTCCASHALNFSNGSATTKKAMCAC